MSALTFEIVKMDFTRSDGLVSVRIRRLNQQIPKQNGIHKPANEKKIENQENHQNDQEDTIEVDSSKLVTDKIRIKRLEVLALKQLLKKPFNFQEMPSFYSYYGQKLIEIDFGKIELYNIKGENQYSEIELQGIQEDSFIRWGKIFSIQDLRPQNDRSEDDLQQIVQFQFYNLLVREKIFTLRNLFYYKNDEQRKAFPYQYLYICDIEDTLLFSQQRLNDKQSQHFEQNQDEEEFDQIYSPLIFKKEFYLAYFKKYSLKNIIIPSFFQDTNGGKNMIYFIHVSEKVGQSKKYSVKIFFPVSSDKQELVRTEIIELLTKIEIRVELKDVQFDNRQNQYSIEDYVLYIEQTFFLSKINKQQLMQKYFVTLPENLSKKPPHTLLDKSIVIPDNIQEIFQLHGLIQDQKY